MTNSQPSNEKLYAPRDHYALSPHFERHMLAMTGEGLYSKSAIAAELAHRDIEIERLRPMAESWESYEAAQERRAGITSVETMVMLPDGPAPFRPTDEVIRRVCLGGMRATEEGREIITYLRWLERRQAVEALRRTDTRLAGDIEYCLAKINPATDVHAILAEVMKNLRTPQGESALNRANGSRLPSTREPVVTAPQGNSGESPALFERLRARIHEMRAALYTYGNYGEPIGGPLLDGVLDAIDKLGAAEPSDCQHDLLKPNTTIEVIDKWKAKCTVCIEFFDLPGRPEKARAPLIKTSPVSGLPMGWDGKEPWFKVGDYVRPKTPFAGCRPLCTITKIIETGFSYTHKPIPTGSPHWGHYEGGTTYMPSDYELASENGSEKQL